MRSTIDDATRWMRCGLRGGVAALALLAATPAFGQDPTFGASGVQPSRSYASPTAFESVDTLGGNVLLQHADLGLAGDNGRSVQFVRTLNGRSGTWAYGFAGLPLFIRDAYWPLAGGMSPADLNTYARGEIFTAEGGAMPLWGPSTACVTANDCRLLYTAGFWRLDREASRLDRPDGLSLFYGPRTADGMQRLADVRDPFGRVIVHVDWAADSLQLTQFVTPGSRTIVVHFSALTLGAGSTVFTVTSIVYDGRTWSYTPTLATRPDGLTWMYTFGGGHLSDVTTPLGGMIHYDWDTHTFTRDPTGLPPADYPPTVTMDVVVQRRVESAAGLATGIWTYAYDTPAAHVTTVTSPEAFSTAYHYALTVYAGQEYTNLVQVVVSDTAGPRLEVERTFQRLDTIVHPAHGVDWVP